MSLSDQRRYPRFPFHSQAQLFVDGRSIHGTLMDISLAGALFVAAYGPVPASESECRLTILQQRRALATPLNGRIVHRSGASLGVSFKDIDTGAAEELRRLVEMNLGMPRLLDRDLAALLR